MKANFVDKSVTLNIHDLPELAINGPMKSSWILLKGIKAGEGKIGCNRPVFRVGGIFCF